METIKKNKLFTEYKISLLFLVAFCFFITRWGISFYNLKEDLIVKILYESISDGSFYYPLIKFLSNLDFNNSFNPLIHDLKILPIPFGSLIIHTFFYKLFGILGFIIVDYFGILFFLIIFYKIFLSFNTQNNSIFLSILLFSIPLLISFFIKDLNTIPFNQLEDFFTLRVHRPFPSSLYIFTFIYIIILMEIDKIIKKKYFFAIGILLGLTFSSFYYFFLIEILTLFFFLLLKFKKQIFLKIIIHKIYFLILIFTSVLTSIPFVFFLNYSEQDVIISSGVFELSYEKKLFLLNYLFRILFDIKFLLINFTILFICFLTNSKKIGNVKIVNIFTLIYISSIFSPFLFIFLSPKSGILYHFNNNIIIFGVLLLFVSIINFINSYKLFNINLKFVYIFIIFISFLIFNEQTKKQNLKIDERSEFNNIVKIIKQKNVNNKLNSMLTFNKMFMKWAVLNKEIDYLNLTYSGLAPKTNDLIENDLINVFKFLGLNSTDFIKFLRNEKHGWRYINYNSAKFFYMKYTANSLNRFNNSKKFKPEVLKFIMKSSPLYSQQMAIPLDEFIRFTNKFDNLEKQNFFDPKIILLEKNTEIIDKIIINKKIYCKMYDGIFYVVFLNKANNINCK